MPGKAILAHEYFAPTWHLAIFEHITCELQMPFFAGLFARVRVDISRAEPARCASQAYCVTIVPLSISQHVLVELVAGQHLFASVAAPGVCLALAQDAL